MLGPLIVPLTFPDAAYTAAAVATVRSSTRAFEKSCVSTVSCNVIAYGSTVVSSAINAEDLFISFSKTIVQLRAGVNRGEPKLYRRRMLWLLLEMTTGASEKFKHRAVEARRPFGRVIHSCGSRAMLWVLGVWVLFVFSVGRIGPQEAF